MVVLYTNYVNDLNVSLYICLIHPELKMVENKLKEKLIVKEII